MIVPEFTIELIVGAVNVLFVNVSSVVLPTRVSVMVGNVIVPEFTIELIVGVVNVLFVNISVVSRPTRVSVSVGNVIVPEFKIELIVGVVNVLFVNVSSVARPTRVSVSVGNVIVPEFTIELIIGVVNVLFVNVWESVNVVTVSSIAIITVFDSWGIVVSIPVPPVNDRVSESKSIFLAPSLSEEIPSVVDIVFIPAFVILPLESTVKLGICVVDP